MNKYRYLDVFSKLLAVENVSVVFDKSLTTAHFNVKTRTVAIPLWDNCSNETMIYLASHEVGHALYTDQNIFDKMEKIKDEYNPDILHIIFNIIEDARIEKLLQRKFLGVSYFFKIGSKELFRRFKTNDSLNKKKEEDDLNKEDNLKISDFFDRANIYFKYDRYQLSNTVFTDDEKLDIDKIYLLETQDETFELGKILYKKYITPEQEESFKKAAELAKKLGQALSDLIQDILDGKLSEKKLDGINPEHILQGFGISIEMQKKLKELVKGVAKAFDKRTSNNSDKSASNVTVVNTKSKVRSFRDTFLELNQFYNKSTNNNSQILNYLSNINKNVSYMVSLFEVKKRGEISKKIKITDTGTLNQNTLHRYKYSDDIFKKRIDLPVGKNHGLLVFLDCSGSMSNIYSSAVDQCCLLAKFCKRINVPFKIYGFRDDHNRSGGDDGVILHTYFSSEGTSEQINQQIKNMYMLGRSIDTGNTHKNHGLTGTPLVSTTLNAIRLTRDFKINNNIDVMNLLFISDGEATDSLSGIASDGFCSFSHPFFKFSRLYNYSNLKAKSDFYTRNVSGSFSSLIAYDSLKFLGNDINLLGISLVDNDGSGLDPDIKKLIKSKKSASTKKCYPFDSYYFINSNDLDALSDSNSRNRCFSENKHFINAFIDAFVGKI